MHQERYSVPTDSSEARWFSMRGSRPKDSGFLVTLLVPDCSNTAFFNPFNPIPMKDIAGQKAYVLTTYDARTSGTARLIRDLLILEERVNNQESQSAYFRWGIKSVLARYEALQGAYKYMRRRFNQTTAERLIDYRAEKKHFLEHEVPKIYPGFVRGCYGSGAIFDIARAEDFIYWKTITETMPEWKDIRNHDHIIEAVMLVEPNQA